MTDRGFERLSAAEALRALYLDFEGEKGELPIIVGVHRRGRGARPYVHLDVLDETFSALAGSVASLRDAVEKVVMRAESGDRRIVSWSEYDLKVVRGLATSDAELVARFEARYANARRVAERWRNKCHGGDKPEVGSLANYLVLIEYAVPEEAPFGQVGDTIRILRARLERGLPLTSSQRERWSRLLEHNRHDCIGMRRICLRAAEELEEQNR